MQFCCRTFHVFDREELPKLIRRLNHEKNAIKESGIPVDGQHYKIKFVGKGKWTPLLEQDIFLVPCNSQRSKHWFLLTLLPKEQEILVLDSMAGAFVKPSAKEAISKMWMLLGELDTKINPSDWNIFCNKPRDIPQQQDDYDCGVYLSMYARCLVLQHPMPTNLASFRKIMVLELHRQQLQPFTC